MNPIDPMVQAFSRMAERPDIYTKIERGTGKKTRYPQEVADMILDLKSQVPSLSQRQLATLLDISRTAVSTLVDGTDLESEPDEKWSTDDNEASAAAELAALRQHHDRYHDHPDAANEHPGRVIFTAPQPVDHYRRADQSHTVKKPITLPKFPFLPIKRYAA